MFEGETQALTDLEFDQPRYRDITRARLAHLASLDLNLSGQSVLDVGSGIGRLAEFFRDRGCQVTCVDGRESNIVRLRELYPDIDGRVLDLESADIDLLPRFDIIFCYGIVYHLMNPMDAIVRLGRRCDGMMLIESCITDSSKPIVKIVRENSEAISHALYGLGSRPSPSYLAACLRLAGFAHVYAPNDLPVDHEYRYDELDDGSDTRAGQLIRTILIGSHATLQNPRLREVPTTS